MAKVNVSHMLAYQMELEFDLVLALEVVVSANLRFVPVIVLTS